MAAILEYGAYGWKIKANAEWCVIREKSVLIPVNREFSILIPVNRARHPQSPPPLRPPFRPSFIMPEGFAVNFMTYFS